MRLSIVIPAHNEEHYLRGCLESVYAEIGRSPHAQPIEVIVVDNASLDGTAELAASFPGVNVVREPWKGLTRARQAGLAKARGEIIGYVDADTRIPSGWIACVLSTFDDSRIVGVSGPCSYFDASKFEAVLVWMYWCFLAIPAYWLTRYMFVGGSFAARKQALEQIGGFDLTIPFYGEDTDIARRLHAVGRVKFTRQLSVAASARRLHAEGITQTALRYVANFLSEVILRRPVTKSYRDIR